MLSNALVLEHDHLHWHAFVPIGRHTSANITAWLESLFTNMGITKKIWACTADGARAQQKAVEDIPSVNIYTLWCACHRLHLVIMDALRAVPVRA
jgi:hypothetical protein